MDGGFEDTEVSHVEEAQEIDDLTAGIRRSRGAEAAGVNARFRHIVSSSDFLLKGHIARVVAGKPSDCRQKQSYGQIFLQVWWRAHWPRMCKSMFSFLTPVKAVG